MMDFALALIEVTLVVSVVWAALFGSTTVCERAFRLLRWVADRPEPRTPRRGPS
ncbi:hypothetical protein [Microtetraspora fusca]|uniref:hypothetical protein n=1 Tax=Microtetraspora fusca TaxID=1997 RepID=UPI000A80E0E1|nr:hypothetical protein [Microtetraspora fusca]